MIHRRFCQRLKMGLPATACSFLPLLSYGNILSSTFLQIISYSQYRQVLLKYFDLHRNGFQNSSTTTLLPARGSSMHVLYSGPQICSVVSSSLSHFFSLTLTHTQISSDALSIDYSLFSRRKNKL